MLRNYFKTAFRNLLNKKTYGFLNIIGLAVGIVCAALIFLWVEDELTYNRHHKDYDRIYRIMEHQTYDDKTYTFGSSPGVLAAAMQEEIPGIEVTARTDWGEKKLFSLGEKAIYEQGFYMDSSFFNVVDFPFIVGSPQKPFDQLHSIVISEKMAMKFFPDANSAYGQSIRVNNEEEFIITGIFKDIPENSTIKFDWGMPFKIFEDQNSWLQFWGNNGVQTFAKIELNADIKKINDQLFDFIQSKDKEAIAKAFLFPMSDWRLYNKWEEGKQVGGRIEYVRLFTTIAWIILIIACINFMNLATARSEQRAREVGVRKVLGAGKESLIGQFISEAVLLSFISVIISVGLIYLFLPAFNKLVEKNLSLEFGNPIHILSLVSIGLICGLVAGSYPSFYLSSFNPTTVFKGLRIKSSGSAGIIRKGLVITQFAVSIILIIGTIIIFKQIQHVKNRDLGFNKENVIYINTQGKIINHFSAIHQDLISSGVVENAALSNQRVHSIGNNGDSFSWPGKDPNKGVLVTQEYVSPQYISTLGMEIKYGRDFYENPAQDSANIIINETFANIIGVENPVGMNLKYNGRDRQVVGVIRNFLYNDMYNAGAPLALFSTSEAVNYMAIRLNDAVNTQAALAGVENVLKKHNPGYPFDYKFLDEEFDKLFKSENLISQLSKIFAGLAIFISCLGLFGLAAYTAEKRTKEIGIRKVLGASVSGIAALLSTDFLKLVALSLVVAFPLAWYFMNKWLQDYAYHIEINWTIFALAGILALIIAIATISFQAIKAALSNPVKNLRTE